MPFKITGRVVDEFGYPLQQAVIIKETPILGIISSADVIADGNGNFTMQTLSDNSIISVISNFYVTRNFTAKTVPAEIRLITDPRLTLTGKTTKKEVDNNWMWLAGFATLAVVLVAVKKGKPAPAQKQLGKPAVKPKNVIV